MKLSQDRKRLAERRSWENLGRSAAPPITHLGRLPYLSSLEQEIIVESLLNLRSDPIHIRPIVAR